MGSAEREADRVDSGETELAPKQPRINWNDPDVPAGNAPPLPRWPLVLAALVWVGWLGFLVAMAVVRTSTEVLAT